MNIDYSSSVVLRASLRTLLLKALRSERHSFAASIFAGDSSLGSESMEMTEITIDSTVWIGSHRSLICCREESWLVGEIDMI